MSRQKGARREREACELYEAAGYRTERSVKSNAYDTRSDWFNLFDIMAIWPGGHLRFAQVKSNTASGVREWMEQAEGLAPPTVKLDFLVCHDREGWRLLKPAIEHTYTTVVDERDYTDGEMGDYVAAYLQGVTDADD
jgi:Holliday junction resolvase